MFCVVALVLAFTVNSVYIKNCLYAKYKQFDEFQSQCTLFITNIIAEPYTIGIMLVKTRMDMYLSTRHRDP
jgi:hypothetical protein